MYWRRRQRRPHMTWLSSTDRNVIWQAATVCRSDRLVRKTAKTRFFFLRRHWRWHRLHYGKVRKAGTCVPIRMNCVGFFLCAKHKLKIKSPAACVCQRRLFMSGSCAIDVYLVTLLPFAGNVQRWIQAIDTCINLCYDARATSTTATTTTKLKWKRSHIVFMWCWTNI